MRFALATLIASATLLASAAQAATFEYRIRDYPASAGDCHQLAAELGAELAARTGVTVTRSLCADISARGYDLRFTYESEQTLPLVTTIDRSQGIDAQGGIFATLSACQGTLPRELERFEEATGLDALVAYCQEDVFSDRPYAHKIDAFGTPRAAPRFGGAFLFGEPIGMSRDEIERSVHAKLVSTGANVSYVKYEPVVGYGNLVFLYYAEAVLPVTAREVVRVETQSQCLATLASLRSVYEESTPAPLAMYCGYRDSHESFEVTVVTAGGQGLLATPSAERFASYSACEAGRPALVARYRDEYDRAIEASACSRDDVRGPWRVVLFERP